MLCENVLRSYTKVSPTFWEVRCKFIFLWEDTADKWDGGGEGSSFAFFWERLPEKEGSVFLGEEGCCDSQRKCVIWFGESQFPRKSSSG